jgi:hypothetical protein
MWGVLITHTTRLHDLKGLDVYLYGLYSVALLVFGGEYEAMGLLVIFVGIDAMVHCLPFAFHLFD